MAGKYIFNEQRVSSISQKCINTKEYRRIDKRRDKAYDMLFDVLNKEQQAMILELDEAFGEVLAYYEDYFYKSGFKDGVEFWRSFESINNNKKECKIV